MSFPIAVAVPCYVFAAVYRTVRFLCLFIVSHICALSSSLFIPLAMYVGGRIVSISARLIRHCTLFIAASTCHRPITRVPCTLGIVQPPRE